MISLLLLAGAAPLADVEPLSDVSACAEVDQTLAAMNAAAKAKNWTLAMEAYEAPFDPPEPLLGASLAAMARSPLPHPLLATYDDFYLPGFADTFVRAALDATGPVAGWDD